MEKRTAVIYANKIARIEIDALREINDKLQDELYNVIDELDTKWNENIDYHDNERMDRRTIDKLTAENSELLAQVSDLQLQLEMMRDKFIGPAELERIQRHDRDEIRELTSRVIRLENGMNIPE